MVSNVQMEIYPSVDSTPVIVDGNFTVSHRKQPRPLAVSIDFERPAQVMLSCLFRSINEFPTIGFMPTCGININMRVWRCDFSGCTTSIFHNRHSITRPTKPVMYGVSFVSRKYNLRCIFVLLLTWINCNPSMNYTHYKVWMKLLIHSKTTTLRWTLGMSNFITLAHITGHVITNPRWS